MKIHLKSIGLLNDVELDMSKKLIIMCGQNNSGKTFASYCIYGLYQLISSRSLGAAPILMSQKDIALLNEQGGIHLDLFALYKNNERKILDYISKNFKRKLPEIFAASSDLFEFSEIKIITDKNSLEKRISSFKIDASFKFGGNLSAKISKELNTTALNVVIIEETVKQIDNNFPREIVNHIINDKLLDFVLDLIFENTYISPAERSAINLFSKELSLKRNEILDELLAYNKNNENSKSILNKAQRYPLPIKNSLKIAEDLATLQKNKSEFEYLALSIEKEILKGKMKISKEGEILFNPNKSNVKNLKIHLSASIVKSLSNLVFYFRHLAKKGDFIIIDEPELNLHPDNQRIIARFIGTIINNGFKVMISTHSDYIVRELNNLIMLKSKEDQAQNLIKKYKYKTEELLQHNDIGVYLFKTNEVNKIDVSESGFEIATIDKEINLINESSQDIYFSLF